MGHLEVTQRITHEDDIITVRQLLEVGSIANGRFVFVEHMNQLARETNQLVVFIKLHVVGYDFDIVFHQARDFQCFVNNISHTG